MKVEVYFYTRPGCHLCEEAKTIINLIQEDLDITLHERNIEEKEEWTEAYGLMIPVIEQQGEMVAYGNVDYVSLLTKLKKKINK